MDKVGKVTGANRGLGFEILREFAKTDAAVTLCSRDRARAQKSASLIKGNIYPQKVDVTNAYSIAGFVGPVVEGHGSVTVAERKKAAMESSMKRSSDPREIATIGASVASDDFVFATGNTTVINRGTVRL